jgi:hypothetical protein
MSDLKNLLRDNKGRTAEERAALREIERELNEAAKANWDDLEWHKEFAAILTESILEGFTL